MAKRQSSENVSEEVRRFLSRNGKKGGQTTKRLIEAGKRMLERREREDRGERDLEEEGRSSYQ